MIVLHLLIALLCVLAILALFQAIVGFSRMLALVDEQDQREIDFWDRR